MSSERAILDLLTPPRTYTVADLLHWADISGELRPHWAEFLAELACQQDAAARNLEVDSDQLQALSEEFRYQQDITTAEETEQWLEQRHVDLESFTAWLERRYWRNVIENPTEPEVQPFADAKADLQALFLDDAIFSGGLNDLALQFGRRLVAHYHPRSDAAPTADEVEVARQRFLQTHSLEASAISGWLETLGRDPLWLEEMISLEAAYRAEVTLLTRPETTS